MTEKTLQFTYQELTIEELCPQDRAIVISSIEATSGSYAPYSHFCVGAALLLESGEVVKGANQENASYPCTTCAERSAINYAQSNFPNQKIVAIAIAARKETEGASGGFTSLVQDLTTNPLPQLFNNVSPCGLCRQAIVEVEQKQQAPIRLLLVGSARILVISSAKSLLPLAFDF